MRIEEKKMQDKRKWNVDTATPLDAHIWTCSYSINYGSVSFLWFFFFCIVRCSRRKCAHVDAEPIKRDAHYTVQHYKWPNSQSSLNEEKKNNNNNSITCSITKRMHAYCSFSNSVEVWWCKLNSRWCAHESLLNENHWMFS